MTDKVHLRLTFELLKDVLVGFTAFCFVGAVVVLGRFQQDLRPFVFATAGAYFVAGFLRGGGPPRVLVRRPVALALGGVLPLAMAAVGGLTPKLQVLGISFLVVAPMWAAAGVATGHFHGIRRRKQACALAATSFFAIFAVILYVVPAWMEARSVAWTNRSVPSFSISTLDGEVLHSADLRGHIVVLAFWATWCPPCQAELPQIADLEAKYRAESDVRVFALNARTGGDTAELARSFLAKRHLQLTAAIDNPIAGQSHGSGQAASSVGLYDLPSLYVLDQRGRLRATYDGYDSSEHLVGSLSRTIDHLRSEKNKE